MNKETVIVRTSTAYIISNPGKPLFKIMEDMSTIDYNTKEAKRFSYWYDPEKDKLWVPGGLGDAYINAKYPDTKIHLMKYMPFKSMPADLKMVHTPDDYQLTTLHNLIRDLKKNPQVKCTLPTGRGKTFVTVNVAMILRMKVLIIMNLQRLSEQWILEFCKHTNMKMKNIRRMTTKDFSDGIYEDTQVYIVLHQTLRSVVNITDDAQVQRFNEWLLKAGIGIKIFDEADTEPDSTFKLDFFTNVCRTMYLTATDYKSSSHDQKAYAKAYQAVNTYGEELFLDHVPNRKAYLVVWNSKPGKILYPRAMSFANEFSPLMYIEYLFMYRVDFLIDICTRARSYLINVARKEINPNARLIICAGRIAYCFILRDMLAKAWDIDWKEIGVYNSAVDSKWKDFEISKDMIISTQKSFGRGLDEKNLDVFLDLEAYISLSQFAQSTGRTGRRGAAEGMYIGIYDMAYEFIRRSYNKKKETFKQHFKEWKIKVEEDKTWDVIDREEAKKVRNKFISTWWKYLKDEPKFNKKKKKEE